MSLGCTSGACVSGTPATGGPFVHSNAHRHRDEIMALPGLTAARNEHVFLVDGLWLTWYGPRIVTALPALEGMLDRARPEWRAPPDDGA